MLNSQAMRMKGASGNRTIPIPRKIPQPMAFMPEFGRGILVGFTVRSRGRRSSLSLSLMIG